MNVRWCALSGGGCSRGGVTNVVSAATHDDRPGCAGLMAGPARSACGTGVANLDLVTMHPAVPNLVPSRFDVAPVKGVDMGIPQGGRSIGRGEVGTPAAHICATESWMSAMALVSMALVATRFLMVVFF
jgi:hypothetical protein